MNTKTILQLLAALVVTAAFSTSSNAQCPFDPVISGNLLLCPESTTTLSAQACDAYQWYRRSYPNGVATPISGATDSTFQVGYGETPVYISLQATQNGCSEQSPEVLVDGLAFLPVTVLSEGTFSAGPNGEHVICVGDTVYLIALQPYTINFQWYNGLDTIPGAQDDTLTVTQPGDFWLTASPGECPNFTANLGLQIPVIWGDTPGCASTSAPEPVVPFDVIVMPNPAQSSVLIGVDISGTVQLTLFNMIGQMVRQKTFDVSTEILTHDLPAGNYTLLLQHPEGRIAKQLLVGK